MSPVVDQGPFARASERRGTYRKYVGTLHESRDGSSLYRHLKSRMEALGREETISFGAIGPEETSANAADRAAGTNSYENSGHANQIHRHFVVELPRRMGPGAVREKLVDGQPATDGGGLWLQVQNGTDEQADGYATKDESIAGSAGYGKKDWDFSIGERSSSGSGKRTDIMKFQEAVRGGEITSYHQAMELHGSLCARAKGFVMEYLRLHQPNPFLLPDDYRLRTWQKNLLDVIMGPMDDRTVLFIVDYEGNNGKSWVTQRLDQLVDRRQEGVAVSEADKRKVCLLRPGKVENVASTLDVRANVFLMDCPREATDFLQYRTLEEIKDRVVVDHKYNSSILQLRENHLIVFMNDVPDMTKLSPDRYAIWKLDASDKEWFDENPPVVPTSGAEFSSDYTGDGPSVYDRVIKSDPVVNPGSAIVPRPGDEEPLADHVPVLMEGQKACLASDFWDLSAGMVGVGVPSYKTSVASRRRFTVSRSCNRVAIDLFAGMMGAPRAHGITELTVDLGAWPSAREIWSRCVDMEDGITVGTELRDTNGIHYCDVDGVWWHLKPTYDRSPPGQDRMCFGGAHALRQQYGNTAGNPGHMAGMVIDNYVAVQKVVHLSDPDQFGPYLRALRSLEVTDWVSDYSVGKVARVGARVNMWNRE